MLDEEVKVVLLGAGSLTFTPSLLKGLMGSMIAKERPVNLSLVDVNSEILDVMYMAGRRMLDSYKKRKEIESFRIEKHVERRKALEGADFVIVTIGVGGVEATHIDADIPLKHGVIQSIGDTVGPGGTFRALRHIPVLLEIARDMEDLCPEAFLFNYSNPMTALTRALIRETKIKAYGLCTGIFGVWQFLADYVDASREEVDLTVAGINHLCWVLDFTVRGEPGYPLLEEKMTEKGVPKSYFGALTFDLYRLFGYIPSPGDRHVAEFFPFLFMNEEAVKKYGISIGFTETIYDFKVRKPMEELIRKVALGEESAEKFLMTKGLEEEGIGVVRLIEAIALNRKILYPGINVANNGAILNLPSWAITEVPAYVDAMGVHPLSVGSLPKDIAGILTTRLFEYETLIDAAMTGDKNLLLRAMVMDGYVKSIDEAKNLMNDMFMAEKEWLPNYWFKQ